MTEQEAKLILNREVSIENAELKKLCEEQQVPLLQLYVGEIYNGDIRSSADGEHWATVDKDEDEIYYTVWGPAESELKAREEDNGSLYAVSKSQQRAYCPEY